MQAKWIKLDLARILAGRDAPNFLPTAEQNLNFWVDVSMA